jgi:hypothetical protein
MPNADWSEGLPSLERTRRAKVEFVWRMWKNGTRRMECDIAAIEGVGFEARFIDNGELYCSRVPNPRTGDAGCGLEKRATTRRWLARTPADATLTVGAAGVFNVRSV